MMRHNRQVYLRRIWHVQGNETDGLRNVYTTSEKYYTKIILLKVI